jgi:hypothetical protein
MSPMAVRESLQLAEVDWLRDEEVVGSNPAGPDRLRVRLRLIKGSSTRMAPDEVSDELADSLLLLDFG